MSLAYSRKGGEKGGLMRCVTKNILVCGITRIFSLGCGLLGRCVYLHDVVTFVIIHRSERKDIHGVLSGGHGEDVTTVVTVV